MAIRFVLGRAGSGKSEYCLQSIKDKLMESPQGRPLILLVPEQATFQAEYALASTEELGGTLRAQVLSFRRLAWRVMQEVGGTARLPMDDTGKKLLLHKILHKHRSALKLFALSSDQMGFIEKINDLFKEFKRYGITADGLTDFMKSTLLKSATLVDKLHDLKLIYSDFESELSRMYLDGEDFLTLLATQLPESDYVRGAACWIDGFHGFTPQEMAVIEGLAGVCTDVTMTLCLDREYRLGDKPHELDLFHPTARTMLQLQERMDRLGIEVQDSIQLPSQPPVRFQESPMLAYMEHTFEQRIKKPYPASDTIPIEAGVRLSAAVHRRAEVEAVARDILQLVRDKQLRYRDIAVTVRNVEAYGDLLSGTFKDLQIPHFFDQKRTVMHHPLIELIRSSLEVILHHWKYDSVFRCVKTDFFLPFEDYDPASKRKSHYERGFVLDRHAMDQLENYVLALGIQGSRWYDGKPWTYSLRTSLEQPEAAASESEAARLRLMNMCRELVAAPLYAFQERMRRSKSVQQQVQALYELLVELKVPDRLESWSQSAIHQGKPEKAREHAQVWDRVMDMLDQLVELMGEEQVSSDTFAQLLETGMESIRLGLVPPSLDQVLIGSMDRTRTGQVKHVFVLGVNEGVMPSKIREESVISEPERELLTDVGLPMAEGARRRLLDEQFLIYNAFCSPTDCLWLSYPLADEEGKSLLPSDLIRHMKRMFPFVKERLVMSEPAESMSLTEQLHFVADPGKTMSYLIVQLKQWMKGARMSGVWWSVYNWFVAQPEWRDRLSGLLQALLYTK